MSIQWRKAGAEELEELVSLRLTVLRAANRLPDDAALPEVAAATRAYYAQAIPSGACILYLAEEDGVLCGMGGVSFYRVMPTCDTPTGEKAYIMSMYTAPAWRRRGIARHTLELLIDEARRRGVSAISLEATDMGRPLYAQAGFLAADHEMYLPE